MLSDLRGHDMVSDRKVIANIPRLHQYMDTNGLEAIAIRSGVNFTYLAGMALPGTLARHLDLANTVRGFMLLWPRKGEPVIVLDSFAEKVALRDSWIPRIAPTSAKPGRWQSPACPHSRCNAVFVRPATACAGS